jgi:hypothetical protein
MDARTRLAATLLAAGLAAACASGASSQARPQAALASSLGAQTEFRRLHARWLEARPEDRRALERDLREYIGRHATDSRARLARLYLAWLLIDRRELDEARRLVDQARSGPAGSTNDFANVARAALLARSGKAVQALALLDPLEGKLVDPDERLLFGAERVLAAKAAGRHDRIAEYMLRWLADAASEDQELLATRIATMLRSLPAPALEKSLETLDSEARSGSGTRRAGARDRMRKLLRERLVQIALADKDGELARRLLDRGPPALGRGERGAELRRIAVSSTGAARVAGRSIGLVLSLGNAEARRRSADVAAGVARALGLPESDADPAGVRLLMAEEEGGEGELAQALQRLAGEGAAVLLGGVDPAGAKIAAGFADSSGIAVIGFEPIADRREGSYFSVGLELARQEALLAEELGRRGKVVPVRVGPGGLSCSSSAPSAGAPRFPVQTWRRDRVDALILLGDPTCARDAIAELGAAGVKPLLAFGVEAAELLSSAAPAAERIAVGAGPFPLGATGNGSTPKDMLEWQRRAGRGPSWYAALGHDAALLASGAMAGFSPDRVDGGRGVAELHQRARRQLASARARLWSSDRPGFEGSRQLERNLIIVSSNGTKP